MQGHAGKRHGRLGVAGKRACRALRSRPLPEAFQPPRCIASARRPWQFARAPQPAASPRPSPPLHGGPGNGAARKTLMSVRADPALPCGHLSPAEWLARLASFASLGERLCRRREVAPFGTRVLEPVYARPARGEGVALGAGGVCSDCRCCPRGPGNAAQLGAAGCQTCACPSRVRRIMLALVTGEGTGECSEPVSSGKPRGEAAGHAFPFGQAWRTMKPRLGPPARAAPPSRGHP